MTKSPRKENKYEHKESFLHKYAKELLRGWLTTRWASVDGLLKSPIRFYYNKESVGPRSYQPDFVYLEYPITKHFPSLIDETTGCARACHYRSMNVYCPCLKCTRCPEFLAIADVVIEHKGIISDVIEIVHKSHLSTNKKKTYAQLMHDNGLFNVYSIEAQHVLGQVEIPQKLNVSHYYEDYWGLIMEFIDPR